MSNLKKFYKDSTIEYNTTLESIQSIIDNDMSIFVQDVLPKKYIRIFKKHTKNYIQTSTYLKDKYKPEMEKIIDEDLLKIKEMFLSILFK